MTIEVIDNFLKESDADAMENFLIKEGDFPWYFCDNVNGHFQLGNYYFNHSLLEDGDPCSKYLEFLDPIISLIPVDSVIGYSRIKANLYPRTQLRVHHRSHTDYSSGNQFTCLYYVNTNNGYTIIDGQGKKKIKSKKNRAIFFDGSILHHSTTCTDVNYRCSINFSCVSQTWPPMKCLSL